MCRPCSLPVLHPPHPFIISDPPYHPPASSCTLSPSILHCFYYSYRPAVPLQGAVQGTCSRHFLRYEIPYAVCRMPYTVYCRPLIAQLPFLPSYLPSHLYYFFSSRLHFVHLYFSTLSSLLLFSSILPCLPDHFMRTLSPHALYFSFTMTGVLVSEMKAREKLLLSQQTHGKKGK